MVDLVKKFKLKRFIASTLGTKVSLKGKALEKFIQKNRDDIWLFWLENKTRIPTLNRNEAMLFLDKRFNHETLEQRKDFLRNSFELLPDPVIDVYKSYLLLNLLEYKELKQKNIGLLYQMEKAIGVDTFHILYAIQYFEKPWLESEDFLPRNYDYHLSAGKPWWVGDALAWSEMLLEYLTPLIEEKLKTKQPLKIWHVGYEDASQTFLTMGLIDEVLKQLKRKPHDLKVELIATDLIIKPKIHGNTIAFTVSSDFPEQYKFPLILEDLSPCDRKRIDKARKQKPPPRGKRRARWELNRGLLLDCLGHFLKGTERFHFMENKIRVIGRAYRMIPGTWQIIDKTSRKRYGKPSPKRVEFVLADIVKDITLKDCDLIVSTNVLPWINYYQENKKKKVKNAFPLYQSIMNLIDALSDEGKLIVDGYNSAWLVDGAHKTRLRAKVAREARQKVEDHQQQILISTPKGLKKYTQGRTWKNIDY